MARIVPMNMLRGILGAGVMPLLVLASGSALALDLAWSGFGTLGYTQSDQPVNYQRFIDEKGSFKRDSVLGAQLDARFSQQWGATVQVKAAPSDHSDSQWQASLAWAFVSWRPSDDWLIRAGKLRLPFMLNTENADVGATYDFVRLPQEVYSIAPTTDVIGLSVSKTWFGERFDWTAEAYSGKASTYWRFYGRDRTMDSNASSGSWFLPIDMKSTGLVLTARSLEHTFRIGYHEGEASRPGAKIGPSFEYSPCPPPAGAPPGSTASLPYCYNVAPGGFDEVRVPIFTLAGSVSLPENFKLTAEYAKMKIASASRGLNRWGGYLALSKRIGAWTPYIYYAKLKSNGESLSQYQQIDSNAGVVIPAYRAYQHMVADILSPYDQSTAAFGTSFWVTPKSVIKAEWSRVNTGVVSSFVDAPVGGESGHRQIDVFSLSYSFTF